MKKNSIKLEKIRHSLAHLLASAALEIDKDVKLGIGPTTLDGFYYDFLFSFKVNEDILQKLEKIMLRLISQKLPFVRKKVSFSEAVKIFSNQPFKLELIKDLKKYGTTDFQEIQLIKNKKRKSKKLNFVSLYKTGEFIDLCKGGHVKNTTEINPKAFKLIKIAGAYWRGDEKREMLTRIYGIAFEKEKDLIDYLKNLENAEKYNHRVLGEKLKIFIISSMVGKGLPLLLPRGEIIKNILIYYMRKKEEKFGYQYVSTPHLASANLYEKSGHLKFYENEMYKVLDPEGEKFFIKPMNCPHHHLIYQQLVKSYKDLPLRLAEAGPVYRVEKSGETYGLMRVRGPITQNDSHIYVAKSQLEEEFEKVLDLFFEVYDDLGVIKNYWFRLSLPDFSGKNKNKYGGDLKLWQWASKTIKKVCLAKKLNFVKGIGEAAFYGPKLDMQIRNIYGKEETIATVQVDVLVPKRMNLIYLDNKNKQQHPVIIHRAILGSYERFIGFLLEATLGDLPLWLSPLQGVILPIQKEHLSYASKILDLLKNYGFRFEIWMSEETLSKRILLAEEQKIPLVLICGDKEIKNQSISLRFRKEGDLGEKKFEDIIKLLNEKGNPPS